jgi:hypothetical protein|mmetsp:Transcript_67854/g.113709  ORF Transcript_67854/g.113709 Transcript_67854/m.113709 type:complete len:87 (+) Transcript_67854:1127-1387(+)
MAGCFVGGASEGSVFVDIAPELNIPMSTQKITSTAMQHHPVPRNAARALSCPDILESVDWSVPVHTVLVSFEASAQTADYHGPWLM